MGRFMFYLGVRDAVVRVVRGDGDDVGLFVNDDGPPRWRDWGRHRLQFWLRLQFGLQFWQRLGRQLR